MDTNTVGARGALLNVVRSLPSEFDRERRLLQVTVVDVEKVITMLIDEMKRTLT